MAEFRHTARRLMDLDDVPETLWVVHSPATRVMCEDADGPHLSLGGHFDWLLALGSDELGLFRLRGPRLLVDDLVFRSSYDPLEVEIVDLEGYTPRRVFTISETPGPWFAVSSPLRGRQRPAVERFTDVLRSRCAEVPIIGS
ncbi:MAG: hypothetical protein AAF480_09685 [Actinomycetota bacterium]